MFSVLKLEKVFTAVSIREVAKRTSPDPNDLTETRRYISDLIASGQLKATLTTSGPTTILRFLPPQNLNRSENDLQLELNLHKRELTEILRHIQLHDHRLEVIKEYVEHLRKLKRQNDVDAHSPGSKGGPSGELLEYEEEMMNDL